MTAAIPATIDDSLNIFIQRADNQVMIVLNGQDIFDFDDQGPSGYGAQLISSLTFDCPLA